MGDRTGSSVSSASFRGSTWHRWDPHLHAPGTLLNDQFEDDWEQYLAKIEGATPQVRAIGVTDYFCIESYKKVREHKQSGRLKNVDFLFPNVEIRLSVETEKKRGLNVHLLFSPDDPSHVSIIERVLSLLTFEFANSRYACSTSEFERLGRAHNPKQTDKVAARREGANQFKITFSSLKDWYYKEEWIRKNCLVAVALAEGDGTAGLQKDASFSALRQDIETFAHIIFSGKATDRDFWLGKKAGFSVSDIEKRYGGFLKPCLHGSDAHRPGEILKPELDRFCWLRGAPTFEGLRQAILEPERRVFIGTEPASITPDYEHISELSLNDAPWFPKERIEINSGLVAIVGARGSGKTALADIIAKAAGAFESSSNEASFLQRASQPDDLLGKASATITWADGRKGKSLLRAASSNSTTPPVRYLSQQFVDRLCGADGLADELVEEIESVVFSAVPAEDRLDAGDFAELRSAHVQEIQADRSAFQEEIKTLTQQLYEIESAHQDIPHNKQQKKDVEQRIEKNRLETDRLVKTSGSDKSKDLATFLALTDAAESALQSIKLKHKRILDLSSEVRRAKIEANAKLTDLTSRYRELGLSSEEWNAFALRFTGNVDELLKRKEDELASSIMRLAGTPEPDIAALGKTEPKEWPLSALRRKVETVRKDVALDSVNTKRVAELHKEKAGLETLQKKLNSIVKEDDEYQSKQDNLFRRRRKAYSDVFLCFDREEVVLRGLYGPLMTRLPAAQAGKAKLQFSVKRRVRLDEWVRIGESLLDLRSAGELKGRGALKEAALNLLQASWERGNSDQVAEAMTAFISKYFPSLRLGMPTTIPEDKKASWFRELGVWLFSTDHIHLEYDILYDGVEIRRLSPGTRGIVLLTVYLAVDEWDRRPLIIDQPEENLDPKSIFDELVFYFRSARERRQVILVTHNANLVINTDVDQVIVAQAERVKGSGLPTLGYEGGGLEDKKIRQEVCALLEGGKRAFLERERRYRFE